ncbi:MAG: DUF262 domain-containing protein [Vampirovibrio sp.]|nr:DUF262 domain-containing protein [Vampirovibrio sp.]
MTNQTLTEAIIGERKKLQTGILPVSIGEFTSMYEDGLINLHPKYQRFFRWKDVDKTSFIESLLIGMPIPHFFVTEDDDGKWDVIDGLQRLSTILEFQGRLKKEDGSVFLPLKLKSGERIVGLENTTYEQLDSKIKFAFRTYRLEITRLLQGTDENVRYELFNLINTKGAPLTEQEVRNCLIVEYSEELLNRIENLGKNEKFQELIALTDLKEEQRYDMELVCRFIFFMDSDCNTLLQKHYAERKGSLATLLTTYLKEKAKIYATDAIFKRHIERCESLFNATIDRLYNLDSNILKKWDLQKQRFAGGFTIAAFEQTFLGYSSFADELLKLDDITILEEIKRLSENYKADKNSFSLDRRTTNIKIGQDAFKALLESNN